MDLLARRRARGGERRGAALILVVVVIAALLAIAAPFVVSMRLHEKSSLQFEAQVRAEHVAESGRNLAAVHLLATHPDEERRARERGGDLSSDPEGSDDWREVSEVPLGPVPGRHGLATDDPTTTLLHVEVHDERGKLDLNTAGPDALANLLGVTVSTAAISYDEDRELRVEDTADFWHDGDPRTIDGFLRVEGEYIAYRHIDRARHAFQGLVRGYLFSRWQPPEDRELRTDYHPAGVLVQDGRGYKLAYDPLWRLVGTDREGQLSRFDSPAAARRIADWEFGTLRAALVLFRFGVNLRQLRRWGLTSGALAEAGLRVHDFDGEAGDPAETPERRRAREAAQRDLRRFGLDPELVRRYGGARAVLRVAEQLRALDPEPRRSVVAAYERRHAQRQGALEKVEGWLRQELRTQLAHLSEARDQAPRLETIGRIELEERLRPFVSVDALPEGEAWSDPQVVNHEVRFDVNDVGATVRLQDVRRFRRFAAVQLRPRAGTPAAALPPEFRLCLAVGQRGDRVTVFPQLDRDYDASQLEVSVRLPRPVNVNTARLEVLRAALTGLQSRVGQPQRATGRHAPDIVTPTEAEAIARAIVDREGGLTGHQDLRALLLELRSQDAIGDHDVAAVYRNAVDPADPLLARGTVPFCYATSDTYEVASTGIVGTPAGIELARHASREVIRVAPPRPLVWSIDSQADFTDRLYVRGPRPRDSRDEAARLFLPGRWSNLLHTRPAFLGPYGAVVNGMPSRSHAPGEGDIQPLLAREPQQALGQGSAAAPDFTNLSGGPTAGWLRFERWTNQLEGVPLESITLAGTDVPTRWIQLEDGSGVQSLGPGLIRGWFRLDRLPLADEKAFLFDGGEGDTIDRIALYLDGPGRLVLEAWDEALDMGESGGSPRSARVVHTRAAPFREGNWYHVAAYFRGTEPGDLALAVDGAFTFREETVGSRLAAPLDRTATTLTVEDASAFPDHGWVRVGAPRWLAQPSVDDRGIADTGADANARCEVLHYSRKSGNVLHLDVQALPLASVAASGARILRVRDLATGQDLDPGSLPLDARRPERGSGHHVRVDYAPAPPATGRRNFTFMLGYPHDAGTLVVPYGYHSRIKSEPATGGAAGFQDVVRRGQRSLLHPLPENTPATVLYRPQGAYSRQQRQDDPTFDERPEVLTATETRIPVLWAAPFADRPVDPAPLPPLNPGDPNESDALRPRNVVGGWPPAGVVRISSVWASPRTGSIYQSVERVYYRRIVKAGPQYFLDGCVRGVEGTTPQPHVLFASVVLESIEVDGDPADYPPRQDLAEPRVYVSLSRRDPSSTSGRAVEWLSIQHPSQPRVLDGRNFLLLPARDSLAGAAPTIQLPNGQAVTLPGAPPGAVDFPYQRELIEQLLLMDGDFGDPDVLVATPDPLQPFGLPLPVRGQLWKEVLKRWDPSAARPFRLQVGGRGQTIPFFQQGARKVKGTAPPTDGWPAGTAVVPTFAIRPEDGANWGAWANPTPPYGAECGGGDLVTIADDQEGAAPRREEARIAYVAPSVAAPSAVAQLAAQLGLVPDAANGWLVAFEDFVRREYRGDAQARLAKWPVGNLHFLPELTFGRARTPLGPSDTVADAPGTLPGRIDDLVVQQLDEGRGSMLTLHGSSTASDATSPPAQVNAERWGDGRLYLAPGGEVIAVTGAAQVDPPPGSRSSFSRLTLARGALGTQAVARGSETPLWQLPWPPVAVATGGFGGARGALLPIQPIRGDRAFREGVDGGYLRVGADVTGDGRVLPYRRLVPRGRNGAYFERPLDRLDRGVLRSAFGTQPTAPQAGELLVDLPFRHHDRYRDGLDSLQGLFFQASRELPGAFVERIEWDEHLPPHSRADVKVAVRIDGEPSWDATPVADGPGQRGRLYLFDDPRADNLIGLRAERVELRVFLTFRPGAFDDDGWKDGALVGRVQVHYRQATQSLRREERAE